MARKTAVYVESGEGRDKDKRYLLTELPAERAERWAIRAFLAIAKAGIEIPDGLADMGVAGLASMGLTWVGKIDFETADVLLKEMMGCVQAMPNPDNSAIVRALVDTDIEEVRTRFNIRKAIIDLHISF